MKPIVLPLALFALAAAAPRTAPVPEASIVAPDAIVANPSNRLTLDLSNGGRVVIQLRPDIAPQAVLRMQSLAQQHFYDGLAFHRVIPGFMAQGGDPKGDGSGGSALPNVAAEFGDVPHLRGTVAMARATDPNSANSQFYIMFSPKAALDHKYTVIGRVVEGMAAVDSIAPGEPPEQPTRIVRATLGAPIANPTPLPAAPAVTPVPPPAAAPAPVRAPSPAPRRGAQRLRPAPTH